MGTRCLTVFKANDDSEIAVLYRQFDGYPDGHGKKLADFLKGKEIINGFRGDEDKSKVFNGMGCLAASVVSHFKDGPGSFYLYPSGTRDVWEDYVYTVYGDVGQEPRISVNDFDGPASQYEDWLKTEA